MKEETRSYDNTIWFIFWLGTSNYQHKPWTFVIGKVDQDHIRLESTAKSVCTWRNIKMRNNFLKRTIWKKHSISYVATNACMTSDDNQRPLWPSFESESSPEHPLNFQKAKKILGLFLLCQSAAWDWHPWERSEKRGSQKSVTCASVFGINRDDTLTAASHLNSLDLLRVIALQQQQPWSQR